MTLANSTASSLKPVALPRSANGAIGEQALKIYPWICGRCAREFTRANVRELTVHHRDHNHDNNPPDGSNWELLCLYCHENEHQRHLEATGRGSSPSVGGRASTYTPFADLKKLLAKKQLPK